MGGVIGKKKQCGKNLSEQIWLKICKQNSGGKFSVETFGEKMPHLISLNAFKRYSIH